MVQNGLEPTKKVENPIIAPGTHRQRTKPSNWEKNKILRLQCQEKVFQGISLIDVNFRANFFVLIKDNNLKLERELLNL